MENWKFNEFCVQKIVENLPVFTIKKRQSLPVVNHYLIVFNRYSVFLDWKNGAE